ncbi:hypothetical protein EI94DRAFT_1524920, partial [Lactarius quietus]
ALLSHTAAEALCAGIVLSDIVKGRLTYKNAFDGREAVDKTAYFIKTTDCNLALLQGTRLTHKSTSIFTHDHRLLGSQADVYNSVRAGSPFYSGELSLPPGVLLPTGVFTLLTDCYSPT